MWLQRQVRLEPRARGCHLVTAEVLDAVPETAGLAAGLLHVFVRHTSASLTLNENASRDVLRDLRAWLDRAVPEEAPIWTHVTEGPDDMPAHVKASLLDSALSIPVSDGRPLFGTWQGVYLCEHRDDGGARELVVTVHGEERRSD